MKRPGSFSGAIAAAFRSEAVKARTETAGQEIAFPDFLVSEDYCAPFFRESGTWPSPVVQAIAAASAGLPVTTIDEELCREVFGCGLDELPDRQLRDIVVGAGRGGGKTSSLLVPAAVHKAWSCPLPNVKRREMPAAVVVCPEKEQARAAFNYALGLIEASPILREYLDRGATNKERIVLRRPDGRAVEILTPAARSGGGSIRSKTLVFCGLDEASFFRGEGFAVNDRDVYDAAKGAITSRRVKGAQIWAVSSPWIEGEGLMEALIEADHGRHEHALVAARVSTYMLRGEPDDGSLRAEYRPDEEDAYRREILAIPLPKGSKAFFSGLELKAACERLAPRVTPAERAGGVDLAHSSDASAAAVAARYLAPKGAEGAATGPVFALLAIREVASSPSQKPSDTYRLLADLLADHQVTRYAADNHYKATLREVTDPKGITFTDAPDYVTPWLAARDIVAEGRLALGSMPEAHREALCTQLAGVAAIERPDKPGAIRIVLPRTKGPGPKGGGGGSHCDAAAAAVLALWMVGSADRARWGTVVDRPRAPASVSDDGRRVGAGGLGRAHVAAPPPAGGGTTKAGPGGVPRWRRGGW